SRNRTVLLIGPLNSTIICSGLMSVILETSLTKRGVILMKNETIMVQISNKETSELMALGILNFPHFTRLSKLKTGRAIKDKIKPNKMPATTSEKYQTRTKIKPIIKNVMI